MAFRFDKLTLKAQEAVTRAQELAADRGHAQIDPLHLLAALLAENDGIVGPILERIGVNRGAIGQDRRGRIGPFRQGLRRGAAAAQPGIQPGARSRPARSRHDERRVRLDRTPAAGADESRIEGQKRPEAQRHHRKGTAARCLQAVRGSTPRDRPNARKTSSRPCNDTASIWSSGRGKASSIRSSAATRKSAASCRCFRGGRRTIPC